MAAAVTPTPPREHPPATAGSRASRCGSSAFHHSPPKSPEEHVEQDRGYSTPCWIWQRTKTPDGYGLQNGKGAHRIYYERHVAPIPAGHHIDHLCRVPSCVNPDHLEPVTPAENVRRGKSTRLTNADVRAIRAARGSAANLAVRYGVAQGYVEQLRRGDKRNDEAFAPPETLPCIECGADCHRPSDHFSRVRTDRLYCTAACKMRAYRRRKSAR